MFIFPSFYHVYLEKAYESHSPVTLESAVATITRYSRVNLTLLRKLLHGIFIFNSHFSRVKEAKKTRLANHLYEIGGKKKKNTEIQ